MRKNYLKDLPVFQFHLLQKFSDQVEHAVFSREGGVSKRPYDSLNVRFGIGDNHKNVQENRKRVCNALGIEPERLVSANQTHSKNVKVIDDAALEKMSPGYEFDDVDAFVTNLDEVGLMVQVADCQAQLMYDPVKRVVAAVHAGWKGLARDISGTAIDVMESKFGVDPGNILIGIAPSLGPCCAFFSNPEKELPKSFHKYIDSKKRVDLWSFSLDQLQKHGIEKRNIELAKVCTQCGNGKSIEGSHRFYSFRGEKGVTGRFGVAIYLKGGF
jgi:polyphenol oxidase